MSRAKRASNSIKESWETPIERSMGILASLGSMDNSLELLFYLGG